jgi:4-amino-4-deoxy-L-arabinose transferase-like glycosyltransferase
MEDTKVGIFLSRVSEKSNLFLLLFFMTIAVTMRLFSFWNSVLDHDESTYMIIGRDILNGKELYTDVTDTKPVGIFLFYAGLEFLFGSSIFMKRFVFSLVVGATAFLIFRISKKMFSQNRVALASGLIYIFYTSVWNYHGRSPNTELLFNLCTAGALLLFLKPNFRNYFTGGLILGVGFIVKYLVLFDFMAFMLFFFLLETIRSKKIFNWPRLLQYFFAGIAFSIPFLLVNLYFLLGDHFSDFCYVTYQLPGNYGSNPSLIRYFVMLLDLTSKFFPVSYIIFYVIFSKNKLFLVENKWFFALWIAAVLLAIYIPGKEFSHYTIQLMLPFSLLGGIFFHPEFIKDRFTVKLYSRKTGWALLSVILITAQVVSFQSDIADPDYPEEVAGYISDNMKKGDKVYVSNYEQIIYYLLGIDSPTKYVHSNLLFTETHKAFNISASHEIGRIINTRPRYVVVYRKNVLVEGLIQKKYHLVKTYRNNEIKIYRRSD